MTPPPSANLDQHLSGLREQAVEREHRPVLRIVQQAVLDVHHIRMEQDGVDVPVGILQL
jgi:hypothetical protein